jgi:moderate conductance mechanosensitive channel
VAAAPIGTAVAGPATLTTACHSASPGIACRLVWDLSHSTHAADFTSVYLAGPIRLGLRIALVLIIAALVRFAARRVIDKITARAASRESERRAVFGERRSQRGTAIGSLLGNAASVTIFTIAVLIILGDIGLNLAPILASAGVLGIAIGFGAQNLVQDFLAGIFILLEDQYGVGDVVDIGAVSGNVEAVSLRITRLRDVNGVVWHIRNGTIKRAGNQTHGWARAVVDYPVPPGMPVAAARRALERAAIQMSVEPRWRASILEPPEVWGIETISPEGVLVRVTARTAPLARPEVTRALRERLKAALDAEQAAGQAIPRQAEAAEADVSGPPLDAGNAGPASPGPAPAGA